MKLHVLCALWHHQTMLKLLKSIVLQLFMCWKCNFEAVNFGFDQFTYSTYYYWLPFFPRRYTLDACASRIFNINYPFIWREKVYFLCFALAFVVRLWVSFHRFTFSKFDDDGKWDALSMCILPCLSMWIFCCCSIDETEQMNSEHWTL